MEQEIQPQPQQLNSIPPNDKTRKIIFVSAMSLLVLIIAGGVVWWKMQYRECSDILVDCALPAQNKNNISSWKTYQNTQYGFEVQYPDGWSVYSDEARYPESDRSDPRFSVTESSPIKDSKCYASFIFVDAKNPDKYPYSLYSEGGQKQKCQITLDKIISTFKFTTYPVAVDTVKGLPIEIQSNTIFMDWYAIKQKKFNNINTFSHYLAMEKMGINKQTSYDGDVVCNHEEEKALISPDTKKIACISYSLGYLDLSIYDKVKKISGVLQSCATCSEPDGFWLNNDKFILLSNYKDDEFQIYKEFIVVQQFDFEKNRSDSWSAGVKND